MKTDAITKNEEGNYICRDSNESDMESYVVVIVQDPLAPLFTHTKNMNESEVKIQHLKPLELICQADGIPKPTIIWTKDNAEFIVNVSTSVIDQPRIKFSEDNSRVEFTVTIPEDEGQYSCEAKNKVATIKRTMKLTLLDKPTGLNYIYVSIFIIIIIIFMVIMVILMLKVRRESVSIFFKVYGKKFICF